VFALLREGQRASRIGKFRQLNKTMHEHTISIYRAASARA
jgi:hypothetical protein